MITGKANYEICGKGIGADLITHPELLEGPVYASESAAWFWNFRSLNTYADLDNFEAITRRINGGLNGQESRVEFWERSKSSLT